MGTLSRNIFHMLALAQEIPEKLTARNIENKEEHFNKPFWFTLSK